MEKKLLARYPIGNPDRAWRQDNFITAASTSGPILLDVGDDISCEKARRGTETAVQAGFNMLEMLWASPEVGMEIVRTAERLGTKVIYQNLRRFGGMGFSKTKLLAGEDEFAQVIDELKDYNCIAGYCTYDEPTNKEQRAVIRAYIEHMEKVCPQLLPHTVSAAFADHMDDLADEVGPAQFSFDIYPFGNIDQKLEANDQLDHCNLWPCMERARRTAKRTGAPFWFYYQGHALFYFPSFDRYTFDASRMMANAALLYGAKQVCAYVNFDGYVDSATGGPGVHFEAQKQLNKEILNLGNTLMALECKRVIHDESVTIDTHHKAAWEEMSSTMEDSEYLTGALPHRLSVSELEDAYGHRYLMVLNRDYRQELHASLKLKARSNVYRTSEQDGLETLYVNNAEKFTVHLTPGSLALFRIQDAAEALYTIEYYLDKSAK